MNLRRALSARMEVSRPDRGTPRWGCGAVRASGGESLMGAASRHLRRCSPREPRMFFRMPAGPQTLFPLLLVQTRPAGSGVVRTVSAWPLRCLPSARLLVIPAAHTRRLCTVKPPTPWREGAAHPVAGEHPSPAGRRQRGVQMHSCGVGRRPGELPDCGWSPRCPCRCEEPGDLQERRLVGRDDVDVPRSGPGKMPRCVVFHVLADGCRLAGVTGTVEWSPVRRPPPCGTGGCGAVPPALLRRHRFG